MATTYSSDKVASTVQAVAGVGLHVVYAEYEAATALVLDDVIQMVKVPKGATVVELILAVDDLDSGTDLVLDVGDGSDDDRYILGSTIGQAGGLARLGAGITAATTPSAFNYEYTAEDTIDVHVDTAPAGGGTGTIKMAVFYTMQQ